MKLNQLKALIALADGHRIAGAADTCSVHTPCSRWRAQKDGYGHWIERLKLHA